MTHRVYPSTLFAALLALLPLTASPAAAQSISVELRDSYGAAATSFQEFEPITLYVRDSGLVGAGSIEVVVESQLRGDQEWVVLTESPAASGTFSAVLATAASLDSAPPAYSDGTLEVTELAGPPLQRDTISLSFYGCSFAGCPIAYATMRGNLIRLLDSQGYDLTVGRPTFSIIIWVRDYSAIAENSITASIGGSGDSEIVNLNRVSGPADFVASIQVFYGSANPGDGWLHVEAGTSVTASIPDPLGLSNSTDSVNIAEDRISLVDRNGNESFDLLIGGPIRVRYEAPAANLDDLAVETFPATVKAFSGGTLRDSETLLLMETGAATGVFEGQLPSDLIAAGSGIAGDGMLEMIEANAIVEARASNLSTTARFWIGLVRFVDQNGSRVYEVEPGNADIELESYLANVDPDAADQASLSVRTFQAYNSDFETVVLSEQGVDSSIFRGSLPVLMRDTPQVGNGRIEAVLYDTVHASYGPQGYAFGQARLIADPDNQTPEALNDTVATSEDQILDISPLANDSDPDGDLLSLVTYSQGAHGTVALVPGDPTRLRYTPVANYFGPDSFEYVTMDTSGASALATVNITVAAVDDPPVAVNDRVSGNEDSSIYIQALVNDSDPEGAAVTLVRFDATSANGTIFAQAAPYNFRYRANPHWNGTDSFTYEIEAGGQRATGVVTVTVLPVEDVPVAVADSASTLEETPVTIAVMANDQEYDGQTIRIYNVMSTGNAVANANGTITFTPPANFFGSASFLYSIYDSNNWVSPSARVTVTVTNVNDPPVANNDTLSAAEEVLTTLSVRMNDSDPDAESLVVQSVTQASHGTVTLANGNVQYRSHVNYNGPDSFTYTVADAAGLTSTATVSLTVTPTNDPPVAVTDVVTTAEDTQILIDILANDTDMEGDSLGIYSWSSPTRGTVANVVVDGRTHFRYTPNLNYNGTDSFSYSARDPSGSISASTTVSITVTPVNDPPTALLDTATTAEDTTVVINVLANDSDIEGNSLSVVGATLGGGATGTVTINPNKTLTYVPGLNYFGTTGFITYQVSDGSLTSTGTVTLNVTPVNDPPIAVADTVTTLEDQPVSLNVLANDSDDSGPVSLYLSFPGIGASMTSVNTQTGVATFYPQPNFNGTGSFSYIVKDSTGLSSTGSVTVYVTPVNDAPAAVADTVTVAEDSSITVPVLTNDSDIDGDPLVITAAGSALHGTVTFDGSSLTYTPPADYNGPDSVEYTISDGNDATATATVTFTVTAINDPPVALADTYSLAEDGSGSFPVLANDSDPENQTLTITAAGGAAHGTVTFDAGSVSYTPAADYNGTDSFSYTMSDALGGTATATVTVTVTAVNDPPVPAADSFATLEDTPLTFSPLGNDSDPDGDSLSIGTITSVTGGSASATAGSITFSPAADWSGAASVHFMVEDGQGGSAAAVATITVSAVNDLPVAVADAGAVPEDGSLTLQPLLNDTDLETPSGLAVTAVGSAAYGTVSFTTASVTYTPSANYHGPDVFTYTIADPQGSTATATVSIVVEPVNDPPLAANDSTITNASSSVTVTVLQNDSDLEGTALVVSAVGAPLYGSAVRNANNTVTYTPTPGYSGIDTFTYTASDGSATATATVSVTINNVLNQASVLGLNSVQVETGADVLSGDVVVNTAAAPPFLGATAIVLGSGTTVAAGWDVRSNGVTISTGTTIAANIHSNTLSNSGTILGSTYSPLALPVYPTLPTLQTATPGTTDVSVATNGRITLAPGVYRDLLVAKKGIVTFTGGVYVFRSVVIQREAQLLFSAPSTIQVQLKMSTATLTKIQPAPVSTATAATIVFHIAGINGTNGALASTPKAVEIATDNTLQANFYVPNGTLWLQARTTAQGAFIGRHVRVGPDVQVSLASGW